jgi:hypothetical protein
MAGPVSVLRKAMQTPVPGLIDIAVDYAHNVELGQAMDDNVVA